MNDITHTTALQLPALPEAKVALSFRLATMNDFAWIDALQKKYDKSLGFFPRGQMQGYIEMGGVLVAWASRPCAGMQERMGETPMPREDVPREERAGYIISRDRYLKRDELGVIFQLCVEPGYQRGFVGAALLREVFNRSAYGCRLYGCWCAQDLPANKFWEAMGFVPLAFRAGSDKKKRVHIYWQKRIDGDASNPKSAIQNPKSNTPYWYPFQTTGGAIRADRLVFPIPPGVHWSEVSAVVLPAEVRPALESTATPASRKAREMGTARKSEAKPIVAASRRLFFGPTPAVKQSRPSAAKRKPAPQKPIDRKYLKAARELRDRWLERVNADDIGLLSEGKYHVARALPATKAATMPAAIATTPLLAA